jgi:hypothetical protein
MVAQHRQAEAAEGEHHLQDVQGVEAAGVAHLVPLKQVLEEGEGEAWRGHHDPGAEEAGAHQVLQRQAVAEEEC